MTLMELLVVISILLTLAALLFPVYLNVRTRMDLINCADQLRQIGLAMHMYVHDYGGDTPYFLPSIDFGKYFGIGVDRKVVTCIALLYPRYVKDRDLLVCPSLRRIAPDTVEKAHRLCEERFGMPWSSYYLFDPYWFRLVGKERS